MAKKFVFLLGFFAPLLALSQSLTLLSPLSDVVSESSGLIFLNQKLITHNDSGGEAKLYEIDSLSGNVTREVTILNAQNIDWEALCYDSNFIYIGDFGNNSGSRTDLKIYRVLRNDYFNAENDTVTADVISFGYSDQTDFSSNPSQTNFDAEAFIALNDSLFIFTKNWTNDRTNIYSVSKLPGNYALTKTDSLEVPGLVTGATYNPLSASIFLCGYTLVSPFGLRLSAFDGLPFSEAATESFSFQSPSGYSYQIEGVAGITANLLYFTSESNFLGDAGLYKFRISPTSFSEKEIHPNIILQPNPASDKITIHADQASKLAIYDASGKLMQTVNPGLIDISNFPPGIYLVRFLTAKKEIIAVKKLIVR